MSNYFPKLTIKKFYRGRDSWFVLNKDGNCECYRGFETAVHALEWVITNRPEITEADIVDADGSVTPVEWKKTTNLLDAGSPGSVAYVAAYKALLARRGWRIGTFVSVNGRRVKLMPTKAVDCVNGGVVHEF